MELCTLNLRGTRFMIENGCGKDRINPNSPLQNLNADAKNYNEARQEFYFNRSAFMFDYILDYLETGKLHIPSNVCADKIRDELDFWGVQSTELEKCCWKVFYQTDEDIEVIQKLLDNIPSCSKDQLSNEYLDGGFPGRSSKLYHILDNHKSTTQGKIWYGFRTASILLSTILFIMSTMRIFRVKVEDVGPYPYSVKTDVLDLLWTTRPYAVIIIADGVCNLFLTVDWILRFCLAPNKRKFMKNFLNIVELIAWSTSSLGLVMDFYRTSYRIPLTGTGTLGDLITLCWILVGTIFCTKILRIFRLITHNCGVKILLLSLKSSGRELFILITSFACVTIIFAVLMYMAELASESSKSFSNLLVTMWWAIITMTTVGYGDLYPTTPQGRFVGALCALMGILLIALPVAVTSSNFYDFYNFNKYRQRYENAVLKKQERNEISVSSTKV